MQQVTQVDIKEKNNLIVVPLYNHVYALKPT